MEEQNQTEDSKSILKIAVVDDSEFSRNSIAEILEANDYEVVGLAGSAEEGVALSGTTDVNLFLIDVVMPERSGIEMAKILSESMGGIRIIMMSSLNMEQIVIESISSGAVDFLAKPFDPSDLLKAVKKVELELSRDY